MVAFPNLPLAPLGAVGSIVGGLVVLAWRVQETRRPVSLPSIIMPPLGMSTGFFMFLAPPMRIPWSWALTAFALGALVFSYPLLRTSELQQENGVVLLRRSNALLLILGGLLAVRLALHDYVGHFLSPQQTAAVFFILAFGMILRWRTGMYVEYRRLVATGA